MIFPVKLLLHQSNIPKVTGCEEIQRITPGYNVGATPSPFPVRHPLIKTSFPLNLGSEALVK
jgi:hypothetical protein